MANETALPNPKQQDDPRTARMSILTAARRVLTRDGAGAVSFSGVAREAGVGPEIVSSHFHSAQEMLLALAAEDLTSLARAMHEGEPQGGAPKNEVQIQPREGLRKKPVMPAPLEQVMKEVAPDGDKEIVTGAMARLERRVQVMEKAFADIVERHDKSTRERASQLASIEESIGAVLARMDATDKHMSGAMGEMRLALSDAALRLNALEERKHAAAPVAPVPQAAAGPAPAPAAPAEEKPAEARDLGELPTFDGLVLRPEDESGNSGEKPEPGQGETYLSAARRAAMAAADSESAMSDKLEAKRARKGSRTKFLFFACLAPVAILGFAFMALNRNAVTAQVTEVSQPLPPPPPSPPPQVVTGEPSDPTPDQLASSAPLEDLLRAAQGGDVKAERDVGLKYLAGDGIDVDESEAARWLMQAAYKGEPTAEYWLATLYARGHGVPADAFQANHWYEAAAKQGNRRAMHSLAVANFQGWGLEKNLVEAARWFKSAAELGLVDSQFNLAVLYERGAGVPQSLTEAYKWYAIAAAQGDKEAESRVAVLAGQMRPAELAIAQSAAASFKPQPMDESANLATGPAQLPGG